MKKMENKNKINSIKFVDILGLLFIALKLCGIIEWSWWWVLSPFWVGFALCGFFAVLYFIVKKIN